MEASDLLTETEPVIRDWLMKRNCSVSPRQFVAFYVSLALVSLGIAVLLVLNGAWLVLPFTGIELIVVGIAFAIYARHAVDYERIRLFENRLLIEQMNAEELTQFEFNPRWVRVETGATPREPLRPGVARGVGGDRAAPGAASPQTVCRRIAYLSQALRLKRIARTDWQDGAPRETFAFEAARTRTSGADGVEGLNGNFG